MRISQPDNARNATAETKAPPAESVEPSSVPRGPLLEVLLVAKRLCLRSVCGRIAREADFCNEYVVKPRWLHEKSYADPIALCRYLPSPLALPPDDIAASWSARPGGTQDT